MVTLLIRHGDGESSYQCIDEDAAFDKLAEFVKDHWKSDAHGTVPEDEVEMIDRLFEQEGYGYSVVESI